MNDETGPKFRPFVLPQTQMDEFGLRPILMGVILGIIFGASSLYLALKIGMTVSASIPVAVLSITLFKGIAKVFGRPQATILENNLVQTTGSAGESIAFGVAVTMPALLILGYEMEMMRVMLVAVLGGLLGVLMMIPLRWALIVREHGKLKYPEGTACAEVLMVGEQGGMNAKTVFAGFGLGVAYKFINIGLRLFKDVPEKALSWFKGGVIATEVSPELLGVGYIIGPRISSIMVAGGVLSSFVLIPAIMLFGGQLTTPLFPATTLISSMSTHEIWKNYVLYIGAGAVATGGIISLFQSLPIILRSLGAGIANIKSSGLGSRSNIRTEQDLSIKWVALGSLALVIAIWMAPPLHVNLIGAILIVLFGFLFVTVSSRITGEIGSSSNPISGMTVATLLLTCLIFVLMGWIGKEYRLTALSIAAVVCIAASNGGTTSQDLKTGFLVGATPRFQQIGLLIGALSSALVIGWTLLLLNDASTIYHKVDFTNTTVNPQDFVGTQTYEGTNYHVVRYSENQGAIPAGKYLVNEQNQYVYLVDPGINGVLDRRDDGTRVQKYEAPKARLMSLIIDGILTQKLPWELVLLGAFLALVLELCGIASLPFAVGVYLPLSSSMPIFIGGLVRYLVDYKRNKSKSSEASTESEHSSGVLLSSGLIAGGAIAGILIALLSLNESITKSLDLSTLVPQLAQSDTFSYICFGLLALFLFLVGKEKLLSKKP